MLTVSTMAIKYTKELLQEAVKQSINYAGVLRVLDLKQAGGTQSHIASKIKEYKIDTSHFLGQASNRGQKFLHKRRKPDNILVLLPKGSLRERHVLLKRALLESNIEYKCDLDCGTSSTWNNKKIVLEIDHIDGNWLNNQIENLRFLCPNCHSQQDTNKPHKHAVVDQLVGVTTLRK